MRVSNRHLPDRSLSGGLPLIHSLNGFRLHQTAVYLGSQTQFGDIPRPREGSAGVFLDPTQPVADRVRVANKHLSRTAHRRIAVLPRPKRFKLNSIGRQYFSATVCGDEVPRGKPAPDAYQRAAALLDLPPSACLAIEDSVTGTAAAEGAGCPVLVVPNDVAVPHGPRRRHISSLAEATVSDLRRVFAELNSQFGERTA